MVSCGGGDGALGLTGYETGVTMMGWEGLLPGGSGGGGFECGSSD